MLKRSNGVDKYAKETLLHIGQSRYALVPNVYKRILILSVSFTIVKIQRVVDSLETNCLQVKTRGRGGALGKPPAV